MKKIILVCLCCFCLIGCSSSQYERDTTEGQRRFITLEQMEEKIDKKDNFMLLFAQSTCLSCGEVNEVLKDYVLSHNVTIYEVILDFEETSEQDNRMLIDSYFTHFSTTPIFYYLENGKQIDLLLPDASFDEGVFDEWVVKYKIDEKK